MVNYERYRGVNSNYSKNSLHQKLNYSAYIFLVLSFILFFIDKNNFLDLTRVRYFSNFVASPLQNFLNTPINFVSSLPKSISEFINLDKKNSILKIQIERLQSVEIELQKYKRENNDLREILKLPTLTNKLSKLDYRFARTASVISYRNSDFKFAYSINAGTEQGVFKNFVALNQNGLIGRVIEANKNFSVILLLHDFNSRIPVETVDSGELAVLIGDNSNTANLGFLANDSKIIEGEKVVTSGHGGYFPAGITIGYVKIEKNVIKVRPVNNFYSIGWVRLYPPNQFFLNE